MELIQVLEKFKLSEFGQNISNWHITPPKDGKYADFPPKVDKRLVNVLNRAGINNRKTNLAIKDIGILFLSIKAALKTRSTMVRDTNTRRKPTIEDF